MCSSDLFTSAALPVWVTEVTKSYATDSKCQELMQQLTVSPNAIPNFTYTRGILRYKGKIYIGSTTDLRANILDTLHNSELGGHSGERATHQRVKLLFHWPGLKQQIVDFIKNCPVYQLNKGSTANTLASCNPFLCQILLGLTSVWISWKVCHYLKIRISF